MLFDLPEVAGGGIGGSSFFLSSIIPLDGRGRAVLAHLLVEETKELILDLAAVQNSPSGEFYWEVVVELLVMVASKTVVVEHYYLCTVKYRNQQTYDSNSEYCFQTMNCLL